MPGMVTLLGSAPKRRTVATSAQNLAILPRSVKSLTFATFATRKGTWQKTALMGTRRPATSVGARVTLHWSAQVRRQFQELKGKNSLGCGINWHERNQKYTPGRIRAIPKLLKDSVFSLFILARSPTAKKEEADPIDEAAGDQVI